MGWLTGGRVTSRGSRSVTIMTTFGGTKGWSLYGVWITSNLKLNTGATTSCGGRVDFSGGNSDDVSTASFSNLSPGTTYTVSISSSGKYEDINGGGTKTASASGSLSFTTLKEYIVSYNANNGNSTPSSQTVVEGNSATLAAAISRSNSKAAGKITVSYNANGGTGGPTSAQSGEYVNTTTYTFNGWHAGSVDGTSYGANTSYKPTSSITMYAGWDSSTSRTTNPSITLSSTKPTRTNYTFLGWSTSKTATSPTYQPGQTKTFSANTTLYAVWQANPPHNVVVNFTSNTLNSITVSVSAAGLPISKYVLHYGSNTYDMGTSTAYTIPNLSVDTNYDVYVTATNVGGSTDSTHKTLSTRLTNPTLDDISVTNILPFSCTVSTSGSITPKRILSYRFSKDGGATWTAYQSSGTYNWTGLNEETTYTMTVQVKATHEGNNASDTTATKSITITTPADQAKIRRMIDGQWKKGKAYIMVNGQWVKAKKLYIMIDGQWKLNNND